MSTQQLQTAIRAGSQIDVERAIQEMKGSALARSNWEQLISSAPIALKCLGACFMAANSQGTRNIQIPKIPGATLDRPLDLTSNLVRCSNLGTDAFLVANKGMAEIYQLSGMSENKVYDIIDLLGDRRSAAKQLPSSLRMLQDNAESCFAASKNIDESFSNWLLFVKELYEACQSRSGSVASEAAKAITDKAVATQRVVDTKAQIESTKQSMDQLGKSLDAARTAFTKASEAQPSGWDLIGQEIVKGLGQAVIGGLNAAISKMGDSKNNNASGGSQAANNQSSASSGTTKNPAVPVSDPAYVQVTRDLYLYELLKPMVKNSSGEVDWNLASGGSSDGKSGAAFLETMLTLSKTSFSQQTGGGLATTTYNKVLDDAVKVVSEINKVLKESATSINSSRPQKGSETVTRWQTLADSLYENVYTLKLQGQNSAFSPSSSNGVIPDQNLQAPKVDAGASHGQALLQAAAANLKTTADTLDSTSKIYAENAKQLSDQQSSLAEINGTLAKLTADVISLEESKQILLQCIGLIIQLKARIVDLVDFFGMLSTVIKTVSTKLVAQWLETVKVAVTGDASAGSSNMIKIGQYSLESTERTMIMNGSICIAAYFSFFADVASSWRSVSERSIFPGIQLAETLSIEGDNKQKMARLDKWSQDASNNIKDILGKKREEIQNGMRERAEKVRDTLKELPSPPAAIEQITQKVLPALEQSDVKAIEAENNNSAVSILTKRRAM